MNNIYRLYFAIPLIVMLSGFYNYAYCQSNNNNLDSIKAQVQMLSSDTDKVNTLLEHVEGFDCDDSLKKLLLTNDAKKLAEKVGWRKGVLRANRVMGQVYFQCEKNYAVAFDYFQKNVEYSMKNGDKVNQVLAMETIAKQYSYLHDNRKSIDIYREILALDPGPDIDINVWGNEGISFGAIGDYTKALECYD
jgi:tetratricopeptide (TPR) repeat protein